MHDKLDIAQHNKLDIAHHDKLVYSRDINRMSNKATHKTMATPSQKLAQSLEVLNELQEKNGNGAIQTKDITRTHRERLLDNGFIREVIKGWYIPTRPGEPKGESTAWYTSYWKFMSVYLYERFGEDWCLSAEQSISYHAGNRIVPSQILIRSPKAHNNLTKLIHDTSLLEVKGEIPSSDNIENKEGIRIMKLSKAFIECFPGYYHQNPIDARAALTMFRDASELLAKLLEGGHSLIAGRLAGAFRNIGRDRISDDILKTMQSAGYDVRENDPFTEKLSFGISARDISPYVSRIRLMWQHMRGAVIENFPNPQGLPKNIGLYMKQVDEIYVTDAYHSLSIEGYQVTPELIERVRSGTWNPDSVKADMEQRNALAARGYWQAFQAVKVSIEKVIQGENAGRVVDEDHGTWYRELFAPSVTSGIIKPSDLAGYRNDQVFIRGSKHTPLNRDALRDAMPVFFELLTEEPEPSVRVVLGHFIFVYIHPYMDGNGRMGRFLMNTMLASGGYSWTVIPVERRLDYMAALERASVEQDIVPFTGFLAGLMKSKNESR